MGVERVTSSVKLTRKGKKTTKSATIICLPCQEREWDHFFNDLRRRKMSTGLEVGTDRSVSASGYD